MDATLFRLLARELCHRLTGRRLDKIFAPMDGAWTIGVQASPGKEHLLFRPARSAGLLFLSPHKPANPQAPPARVMWLRKRVSGRRVLGCISHWTELRLALELSPRKDADHGRWLVLDARGEGHGIRLTDDLPDGFGEEPHWPSLEAAREPEAWREFPQLSPPLRRALRSLGDDDARALLERLRRGEAEGVFLPRGADGAYAAPPRLWSEGGDEERFDTALAAAAAWGASQLFPDLDQAGERPEVVRARRAAKRVKRAMKKLDAEAERLQAMADGRLAAEALQAELYRFQDLAGDETPGRVRVTHPEAGPLDVDLDASLSVAENMQRLFARADKAARGFTHLARRRNELGKELAKAMARSEAGAQGARVAPPKDSAARKAPPELPKRYRGMAVAVFRSSDGFLLLRGKNKKANHEMLSKAASVFDWWFHAADGPSSHVILKRDHPGQEVPESTIAEAAVLAANRSWRAADAHAEIMYAQVKDVRKVKGFAHGQVAVDQVLGSLRVAPDPALEKRLGK